MCTIMPLIRTYMYKSRDAQLEGLLMYARIIAFSWWFGISLYHIHLFCIVVSQVCQWLLNDDRPAGGRENGEIK